MIQPLPLDDGAPHDPSARQPGGESAPGELDTRIQELEKQKQELEAQRAAAQNTPQETPFGTEDEEPADVEGRSFGIPQLPAWAISLLVHLALLLVLGLITLVTPSVTDFAIIVVSEDGKEPLEQIAEIDLSVDLEEMEDLSPTFEAPSISESKISDVTLDDIAAEVSDIGPQVIVQDSVSQIDAIFSEDGTAKQSLSDKVGEMTASFFGSKSYGKRFVFVVDNSNSMGRGRFYTAADELVKTVEKMEKDQHFYVIFFSDTAYPLFWPTPAREMIPATPKNKELLRRWLYTVQLCFKTRGSEAMKLALSLQPDAIYILGDGAFTDDTTNQLTLPHDRPTPIFTLGMQVDEKGKGQLNRIAKANHGTYRLVTVTPQAVQAALQSPIKKNRTRGPVWGRALPLKPKKK